MELQELNTIKQETTDHFELLLEGEIREALKGILGDSFGVTVEQVTLWDDKGVIFGQPDQIELDVIIKNGTLILCEIKAMASRGDVYIFGKKCTFYATVHQREINRRLIISPMVDKRGHDMAAKLGIEVYSYAEDVTNL